MKPGIFYARRDAFIHFHDDGGVLVRRPEEGRRRRLRPLPARRRRPSSASSSTKPSCAPAGSTMTSDAQRAEPTRDALTTRSRRARADAARSSARDARCRRRSRTRKRTRRRCAERLRDVDPASITSRAALARPAGAAQARAARTAEGGSRASDVFGGFSAIGWGASRPAAGAPLRVFASPGPIHEPEAARARLLAHGARAVRRRLSRRRPGPQLLQLPLHAGRRDDGKRRARDRLHRLSRPAPARPSSRCRRWPRWRPTPTPARRASCGSCSRRPTSSGVALPSLTKASLGGEALPPALRDVARGARHRRLPELRHRRPRPRRLRDRRRAKAWSSTKA